MVEGVVVELYVYAKRVVIRVDIDSQLLSSIEYDLEYDTRSCPGFSAR